MTAPLNYVVKQAQDGLQRLSAQSHLSWQGGTAISALEAIQRLQARVAELEATANTPRIATDDPAPGKMLRAINTAMNGTPHCSGFTLGECAMVCELCKSVVDGTPVYCAAIYIWDKTFNDSAAIAKWFNDAGAESVTVKHILYDELNGDRNGWTDDGARAFDVTFVMKRTGGQP